MLLYVAINHTYNRENTLIKVLEILFLYKINSVWFYNLVDL